MRYLVVLAVGGGGAVLEREGVPEGLGEVDAVNAVGALVVGLNERIVLSSFAIFLFVCLFVLFFAGVCECECLCVCVRVRARTHAHAAHTSDTTEPCMASLVCLMISSLTFCSFDLLRGCNDDVCLCVSSVQTLDFCSFAPLRVYNDGVSLCAFFIYSLINT